MKVIIPTVLILLLHSLCAFSTFNKAPKDTIVKVNNLTVFFEKSQCGRKLNILNHVNNKRWSYCADSLNFVFNKIESAEIIKDCSYLNLVYIENSGNGYFETVHTCPINNTDSLYIVYEYKIISTQNYFDIHYSKLSTPLFLTNYHIYNVYCCTSDHERIYYFEGFQEEKIPSILPFYQNVKNYYESNDKQKVKVFGNINVVKALLQEIWVDNKNIQQFNDLAYYFEQCGLYTSSIMILRSVIKNNPNRTVAFINLGDAYWGNGEPEKAKGAYTKYVELMKLSGKEKKIPKRVSERLKRDLSI